MQCSSILIVQTVLFKDQLYICVSADLDELKIFFFLFKINFSQEAMEVGIPFSK